MYTIFSVLIVITCVLLVLVVLVQNPKGGGLSATLVVEIK
jgi:preprotein translocase subunit SecG